MKKGLQCFLVIVVLFFGTTIHSKTASEIFDAVSSSVAVFLTYDTNGNDKSLGSGVFVASDQIATNCHVIENAAKIHVVYKGKQYLAEVQYTDWDRDVCTLNVNGINAPQVVKGSTSRLKVGARVYAIGAPKGLELTLSEGIISSLRPAVSGQYLQITAPISPGSSGGGLFDEEGRLIGLPTFYLSEGQQLNFAIPVEWINELPERHKKMSEVAQTTSNEWYNKSLALEETKDWVKMLIHSLRWIQAQPEEPMAYYSLGYAYYETDQNAKAIQAYQEALRIYPEYAAAWYNLGYIYDESGQIAEAIQAYQQVLRINPDFADRAWLNLGGAYIKTKQYTKAIQAYQEALRINPKFDEAWSSLGGVYSLSAQYTEAINAHQQALRINPESANAWFLLGITYAQSGQTSQVTEVYNVLKTLDPAKADEFFNKYVLP